MEIKKYDKIYFINNILLVLFLAPVIYIFFKSFDKISENTLYILKKFLYTYSKNTLFILIPTIILSSIIGVFLAYFESFYDFRFRNFFKYVNVLAFCIPSYILGYIYYDIFSIYLYYNFKVSYSIANVYGAIIILSLAFYPYIYIFSRTFFKKIPSSIIDSSTILGKNKVETFFKILLPLSKPALLLSIMLVLIETINSYGLPSFFGIEVFSTGIYKLWVNNFDSQGTFLLSSLLLTFIFFIIFIISKFIGKSSNYKLEYNSNEYKRKKMSKIKEIIVTSLFFLIFIISFIIPVLYLIRWANLVYLDTNYSVLFTISKNSLFLASISSILVVLVSLFILEINRLKNIKIFSKIFLLSYGVPGTVISIALLSIFIGIDRIFFKDTLLISKSSIVLILAFIFRFSTISYNGIKSNITKIGNDFYETSLVLSKSKFKTFLHIELPMLKNSILSTMLLVFIEIIKELPITNINGRIETLAIRINTYAADENLAFISIPSIVLITICFIAISLYIKLEKRENYEIL
ncbi:ABC transporter permease [Oceanivirga salmonicida]|uniref:ABC transporter permease n=1 Tax=Oceanivirga salmonicida TaxID=1769291 RepID=UPI0012E1ED06|nr:iron ABC transporter permease [Oceanivirga salmonicida]